MHIEPEISGLSAEQATMQLKKYGPNILPENQPKSLFSIILKVIKEPMFLMLLFAGGIYMALGDPAEAAFLLCFVFIVIGITFSQERKTQRALESLKELSSPRALVIRDGETTRIASRDVVPGDLLVLNEGDRIPADALLVQGQLSVDESLLTGESVPLNKLSYTSDNAVDESVHQAMSSLFSSTVVTKGHGLAVVQTTGSATAVGQIGQTLTTTDEIPSNLQQASRSLIKNLTISGFVLSTVLFFLNWLWNARSVLESLLSSIALSMAILPEEIPVILTVFLALGAWRIAKYKVLTRDITAVESLGTITTLAVDKTGTLTQNRMRIEELSVENELFTSTQEGELPESFHTMLEFAMLATPINPFDPMEKAIQAFGHQKLSGTEHIHDNRFPEFQYEISQEILAMTHVFSCEEPNVYMLATKGAPEAIIDLCHLPQGESESIHFKVEEMAKRGLRVLAIAKGEWRATHDDQEKPLSQHDFDFTFLGLIGFIDPIRPEVPDAIAECKNAGIRILMLTGDHPATARAIAQKIGLSEHAEVIMGDEISILDDKTIRTRLQNTDVCARMKPEHKLRLIQVLQQAGEIVAMTGDGVNDTPALKAANIGIAMGERGTDVARETAALVLLNDSFKSISTAIMQGRRIYDNIANATRFVIAVHLPIIALTFIPSLLHWPTMIQPIHIVLLQLLIDPACAIVFEAEAASKDIMHRPPRPRSVTPFSKKNIGFGILQGTGIALIMLVGDAILRNIGWTDTEIRVSIFTALIPTLFLLVLFNLNTHKETDYDIKQRNPWLPYMLLGVSLMLASILFIPLLRNIMGFNSITLLIISASLALLTISGLWLKVLRLFKA